MIEEQFNPEGPEWFFSDGAEKDVVLATRVVFLRNLSGYLFPTRAKDILLRQASERIRRALEPLYAFTSFPLGRLKENERNFLAERLILNPYTPLFPSSEIFIAPDEQTVFLTNTSEHLIALSFISGFQPYPVFELAKKRIDELETYLDFAYSQQWGYLTSSPFTMGCGVGISYFLHLWGLANTGKLDKLESEIKNKFRIAGFLGHSYEVVGYLFKLVTIRNLGLSEEEIINDSRIGVRRIINAERDARRNILENARLLIEDKSIRALSILKTARILGHHEALVLLTTVKMGLEAEIILGDLSELLKLFILIQPAHLLALFPDVGDKAFIDGLRADLVRMRIGEFESTG